MAKPADADAIKTAVATPSDVPSATQSAAGTALETRASTTGPRRDARNSCRCGSLALGV